MSGYGVTDMAGNVWQWCADWYDASFWSGRAPEGRDPVNLGVGEQRRRVVRGGSWVDYGALDFRSSNRSGDVGPASWSTYGLGFRCVRRQESN